MTTHFVVERLNWRWHEKGMIRHPGSTRVASFDKYEEAETLCQVKEQAARLRVNPFATVDTFAEVTTMPPNVYADWLQDHDIEPPAMPTATSGWFGWGKATSPPPIDWSAWWVKSKVNWSERQLLAAWEPLTNARFFIVNEKPKRDVVYAVVKVLWNYNDEWYYPGSEGGQLLHAYRSRERAEKECADWNAAERDVWRQQGADPDDMTRDMFLRYPFDMEERRFADENPFEQVRKPPQERDDDDDGGQFSVDEVPFFEVVELECEVTA
jgi:hypothetical protein